MIDSQEIKIQGKWLLVNNHIEEDEASKRIYHLISSYLSKITTDTSGWYILYQDEGDGRYWELSYEQGELQGGGPPTLTCISLEDIQKRYSIII